MNLLSLIPGKTTLYAILAALIFGAGVKVTSWYYKSQDIAAYQEQVERMKVSQDKVATISQEQLDEQMRINDGLADDLERLRNRKPRVPDTASTCEGATGASLSAEDASFLARESARADQLRNALIACYAYADTVNGSR